MPTQRRQRPTVKHLICDGLGYCCEYGFFCLHRRTALIAARLGVSDRAVRYHKMAFKQGGFKCEETVRCIRNQWIAATARLG